MQGRSPSDVIKPEVRRLSAYTLKHVKADVKLDQNENPYELPQDLKEEVARRVLARPWGRYPEFVPHSMIAALSKFTGWTEDGILVGNGSNELILAGLSVVLGSSCKAVIPQPTFTLYKLLSSVFQANAVSVPLNASDFSFNVDALEAEARDAAVTVICSPNNPTGCVLSDDDLCGLLKSNDCLVVVDEAYHEFARHSVVPLLHEHKNLVVLRTFSKAMSMAALRVGYLLAAPELTREIGKAVLPYNLNAFSQTAAEVAIELYQEELRPQVQRIIDERERLYRQLSRLEGLTPLRSQGNFMAVRTNVDPKRVFAELLKQDILIRDVSSYPMLSEYFRVSVGTPEENDLLLEALRKIVEPASRVLEG